ncbi:hypothetical protein L3i22_085500 [Actinoplanes sp. L3-i22]|nr:hypothetical protein L3i22_085500 [Actinoplanes sp. L3-i22]
MVVGSDGAFIAVLILCGLVFIPTTVLSVLFLSAGLSILRAKGYRRAAAWWAVVAVAVPPALCFAVVLEVIADRPSPPTDVAPRSGW